VQLIQSTVETLFPVKRIGVAPGVSAGLVPKHHNGDEMAINLHFRSVQLQENDKSKVINLGARPKDNVTSSQFLPVGVDPQWEDRRIRPIEIQEVRRHQTETLTDEIRVRASDVRGRSTFRFRFPPKDLDLNWREEGFRSAFTRERQEANMFASVAEDAINHDVEVKHSLVSSVLASTAEKSKNVLKLENVFGEGSLQVFLKRFEICSRHNGWSASNRKDHLIISLTDSAAQLIWESSEIETAEDLIKRLEDRFGSKDQQAVYRVQLKNRPQGPDESLSSLVSDIRRLLTLAYITEHSDSHETISIRTI